MAKRKSKVYKIETITTIYEKRVPDRVKELAAQHINRESLRLITNITSDMRKRMQRILRKGEREGKSVSAIASRLLKTGLDKGVFRSARQRAWMIARTELHRARQQAAFDVYRANKITKIRWICIADGRLCERCRKRHNKIFNINRLKTPPPLHPRCRCRAIPKDLKAYIRPKRRRDIGAKAPTPQNYRYVIIGKSLEKAVYPGNLGFVELYQFYRAAPPDAVHRFKSFLSRGHTKSAVAELERFVGYKLHPSVWQRFRSGKYETVHRLLAKSKRVFVPAHQAEGHMVKPYYREDPREKHEPEYGEKQIETAPPDTPEIEKYRREAKTRIEEWRSKTEEQYSDDQIILEGYQWRHWTRKSPDGWHWAMWEEIQKLAREKGFQYKKNLTKQDLLDNPVIPDFEGVFDDSLSDEITTGWRNNPRPTVMWKFINSSSGQVWSVRSKRELWGYVKLMKDEDINNNYPGLVGLKSAKTWEDVLDTDIDIYRGIPEEKEASEAYKNRKFISYSVVPAIADKFARGFYYSYDKGEGTGVVLKRTIKFRDIIGFVNNDGENEVLVRPPKIGQHETFGLREKYKHLKKSEEETIVPKEEIQNFKKIINPRVLKIRHTWDINNIDIEELEKARPYVRFRKQRLEHVKGYAGKQRQADLTPVQRVETFLDPESPDVKMAHQVASEVVAVGGRALFIGGCVRDALLGKISKDVDIEVYGLTAEKLQEVLSKLGKVDAVGRSFGVLKLSNPELSQALDISIPRRDNKTGKGHKGFIVETDPTMTISEAARRRDLTINALAYDPIRKEVIDEFGGLQDLQDKKLRATDPTTFVEDPLRVLRVMQLAARLGFVPDVPLVKLCRSMDLTELPKERVFEEVQKLLLRSKYPSIGLGLISALGINKIMPEIDALKGVEQDKEHHPEGTAWKHTLLVVDAAAKLRNKFKNDRDKLVLMLAALCHDLGKPSTTEVRDGKITTYGHDDAGVGPTNQFLNSLTNETDIQTKVVELVREHMRPTFFYHDQVPDSAIRRLARRVDIPLLVAVSMSDKLGRGLKPNLEAERWLLNKYKELKLDQPKALDPLVMGRHMIQMGMAPGPEMGRVLKQLYEAQLDGKFKTPEEGVAYAQEQGWITGKVYDVATLEKSKRNNKRLLLLKSAKKEGEKMEKNYAMVLDPERFKKRMAELRKSKLLGKKIPIRTERGLEFYKVVKGGFLVKGQGQTTKLGDKILIKGIPAQVTAVGRDGVTARDALSRKYQVFCKDIELIRSREELRK